VNLPADRPFLLLTAGGPITPVMKAAPMTPTEPQPDLSGLTFEKALAELESIVQRLEQGKVDLEESIAIYERGEALKTHCQALLERADARIEKITVGPNGQAAGTTPLDVEA
jgi:exodeoxyribonuclease VII small subunit